MAASVHQRIAFGERAVQKVRRIGSGFGVKGEAPLPMEAPPRVPEGGNQPMPPSQTCAAPGPQAGACGLAASRTHQPLAGKGD